MGPLAAIPICTALIAVAASAALVLQAEPAIAETLTGAPRVVDGDTLEFGSERVRLYGVDAPESKQSCKDRVGKDFPCGVLLLYQIAFLDRSNTEIHQRA